MSYRVTHTTSYNYTREVLMCHNQVHLTPRNTERQILMGIEMAIDPTPEDSTWYQDYYGNEVTFFAIQQPHTQLTITAVSLVDVTPFTPPPADTPAWEAARDMVRAYPDAECLDALQFVFDSTFVKTSRELADFARQSFPAGRPVLEAVFDLSRRIHGAFRYLPASTTISTPIAEVLEKRTGVCQDFAHLMIGCLRSLGLPSRYVSGYLRTGRTADDHELVGADASHAWVSAFCPGLGWVDFDPTNDMIASDEHVTLAWGRDYDDVSPVKGVALGGDEHTIEVTVEVSPA